MSTIIIILLVLAVLCFALAAFWRPVPPRVNLTALGLLLWVLAVLLPLLKIGA